MVEHLRGGGSRHAAAVVPGQVVRRGVFWGAFAWLPVACLAAVIAGLIFAPAALAASMRALGADPFAAVLVYLLVGSGHCAGFVLHALRNARLARAQRMRWVVALALASGVAAPLYWWKGHTAAAQ